MSPASTLNNPLSTASSTSATVKGSGVIGQHDSDEHAGELPFILPVQNPMHSPVNSPVHSPMQDMVQAEAINPLSHSHAVSLNTTTAQTEHAALTTAQTNRLYSTVASTEAAVQSVASSLQMPVTSDAIIATSQSAVDSTLIKAPAQAAMINPISSSLITSLVAAAPKSANTAAPATVETTIQATSISGSTTANTTSQNHYVPTSPASLVAQASTSQSMSSNTSALAAPLAQNAWHNATPHFAATSPFIANIAQEALPADIESSELQALISTAKSHSKVAQWGPVSISPSAPMAMQAQELISPLREQLRFQVDQHIKQAELRLDPPELGKVELNIRLDGDKLHIQMHAVNPAVRDALLTGLERLRNELAMDHGGQIDVDVNQDGMPEGKQNQQQQTQTSSVAAASTSHIDSASAAVTQQDDVNLLA
ncbi:flagellar hook-length control protein FliK [Shewanella sp.]|nr:flagellar hook-length control protein FliK [Shewanella sp.]